MEANPSSEGAHCSPSPVVAWAQVTTGSRLRGAPPGTTTMPDTAMSEPLMDSEW